MDPIATLALINEDHDTYALEDLANWILRGGGVPYDAGMVEEQAIEAMGEGWREIAGAVNCALANDDTSGLRYIMERDQA